MCPTENAIIPSILSQFSKAFFCVGFSDKFATSWLFSIFLDLTVIADQTLKVKSAKNASRSSRDVFFWGWPKTSKFCLGYTCIPSTQTLKSTRQRRIFENSPLLNFATTTLSSKLLITFLRHDTTGPNFKRCGRPCFFSKNSSKSMFC
jgi:hypothetical protein